MLDHPSSRRLTAIRHLRPLTGDVVGGSEPHVFETEDGPYIVKVKNNPQGPKVPANELVSALCLDWLGVEHPDCGIVAIDPGVISAHPGARFVSGKPLDHGSAFGSKLLESVSGHFVQPELIANRSTIAGTLVFDIWIQQFDGRQFRAYPSSASPGRYDLLPIDNGFAFGRPNWTSKDLDGPVDTFAMLEPLTPLESSELAGFIERLSSFDMSAAKRIISEVPDEWLIRQERLSMRKYMCRRAKIAVHLLKKTPLMRLSALSAASHATPNRRLPSRIWSMIATKASRFRGRDGLPRR